MGYLGNSLSDAGQATAPAVDAAIATLTAVPPGTYEFEVVTHQAGTIDTTRLAHLNLRIGSAVVQELLSTTSVARHSGILKITAASNVTVNAVAAFAASSIAIASIRLTKVI